MLNMDDKKNDEIKVEIQENNDNGYKDNDLRIQKAKTLKTLSIINLCVIPIFVSFGLTLLAQFILTLIHNGKKENYELKLAAAICTFLFLIVGSAITLVYANKEIKNN